MAIAWGIVLIILSLLCWGGQTISWLSPATAVRLSLTEAEDSVEPAFFADVRGEALWDALTLWVSLVAGILLIVGSPSWPPFGLAGGAIYVYFAGRGLLTRRELQRRGMAIGTASNAKSAYIFLAIWGLMGAITVIASVVALG